MMEKKASGVWLRLLAGVNSEWLKYVWTVRESFSVIVLNNSVGALAQLTAQHVGFMPSVIQLWERVLYACNFCVVSWFTW